MRLPGPENRTFIVGKTGSGKTRFATWLHAKTSQFKRRPYVIIDTKREKLFSQIDRAREIGINEIPKHPGLYIMRPFQMDPALEPWFMKVLDRATQTSHAGQFLTTDGTTTSWSAIRGRSYFTAS